MLKNNKAQVTIFIVIGIMLIIIVSFLFANSKYELFIDSDTKAKNQIRDVVRACIEDSAQRGVFILGFQGGYIEISNDIKLDSSKHSYLGGLYLPTWDSEQIETVPTISSMETELNQFIIDDSYNCIASNLDALNYIFEIAYDSIESYVVESEIEDEDVNVNANLYVKFNEINSNEVLNVDDYFVSLENVKLGDMYDLAREIYQHEQETYFLEELVLDQIYSASDYSDRDLSLPSEGMSFSCAKQIWTKQGLINNLIQLNQNNFKYLQFKDTYSKEYLLDANFREEFGNTGDRKYFENQYIFELDRTKRSYSNYEVNAFMPISTVFDSNIPITSNPFLNNDAFSVSPSSEEIVKPITLKVGNGKIPIPCIQIYHHLYTLDYDLVFSIQDREVDSSGYLFQFPLRVKIEDNAPKQKNALPLDLEDEGLTVNNENYCSDESYKYPFVVYTRDIYENDLDNVNITYECITLSCDMGKSAYPVTQGFIRYNSPPILETDFPFCFNGKLIGEKDGYHRGTAQITTDGTSPSSQVTPNEVLYLTPLKEFKLETSSVLIVFSDGTSKRLLSEEDGFVYINIENKEENFESSAIWPIEYDELNTLSFLDKDNVKYNVSVIYVDSNDELRGMYDIIDFEPNVNLGNNILITVPASNTEITEENFIAFYETSNDLVQNSDLYGISFN